MNIPTAASTYDNPVALQWSGPWSIARCRNGVVASVVVKYSRWNGFVSLTATTARKTPAPSRRSVVLRWYSRPVYADAKYSHAHTVANPNISPTVYMPSRRGPSSRKNTDFNTAQIPVVPRSPARPSRTSRSLTVQARRSPSRHTSPAMKNEPT